ncbi:MAG: Gfo/Idh/MocA family oxidoreductase [Actinomycetota bacterium]|nr:Gfo/Idh/MocA family oxidoreductase [Actinomycetota bacterium]
MTKDPPAQLTPVDKKPIKPVNVAVIGAGRWGQNLVRKFAELPESNLTTVCDLAIARLEALASRYPETRTTADISEVFLDDEIDAVVVASPAPMHFKHAEAALKAGKHVFVEKPITLDIREAQTLIDLADRFDRILMVGHLLMYHPAITLIKSLIDKQDIGDVYYLYSQRLNLGTVRKDENALWSLAPHDVAVALHLIGKQPLSVAAVGQCCLRPGVQDVVFVTIVFEGGIATHSHVSWLDPHKTRKFTVVGSKKMVVFDDMESSEKVRLYDKGADLSAGYKKYGDDLTLRFGDILIPSIKMQEPLALECNHFLDCVRTGRRPLTDGQNGLDVLRILQAAQASLNENGRPIDLKEIVVD